MGEWISKNKNPLPQAFMVICKMSIWLISIRSIPVSFSPHLAYSRVRIKSEVNLIVMLNKVLLEL